MTEVMPGNNPDKLPKWARATEVIGRKLFDVALVYTLLLGILMLNVAVVGSC